MDAEQFDTLIRSLVVGSSRRRVLSGLASVLSGGVPVALGGSVAAKKKHKRKRKRKRKSPSGSAAGVQSPPPTSTTTTSPPLGTTTTSPSDGCPAGRVFCRGQCRIPDFAACAADGACCSNRCLAQQQRCHPCPGKTCTVDTDCCAGVMCEAGRCGGCLGPGGSPCQTDDDCCYSACNALTFGFACQSFPGQRCLSDFDCLSQDSSCVAGRCSCPTQCCADTDCRPAEECRGGKCEPIAGG
jgi:hypothetical protein